MPDFSKYDIYGREIFDENDPVYQQTLQRIQEIRARGNKVRVVLTKKPFFPPDWCMENHMRQFPTDKILQFLDDFQNGRLYKKPADRYLKELGLILRERGVETDFDFEPYMDAEDLNIPWDDPPDTIERVF